MKLYEVYDAHNELLGTVMAKDEKHACQRLGGVYAVPLVAAT